MTFEILMRKTPEGEKCQRVKFLERSFNFPRITCMQIDKRAGVDESVRSLRAIAGALVLAICLFLVSSSKGQQAFESEQAKLLSFTPDIEEVVKKDMQGCPATGLNVQEAINKNNVYTLTGDLFKNGHIYAIIDNSENVIMAEWIGGQWKAKWLISTCPIWKYPGWSIQTAATREPASTKPFWLLPYGHHQLLVIASYVEKEGQYFYIILFDSTCQSIIATASSFWGKPVVKEDYLVVSDSSRVKSEFEGTYFCKLVKNQFVRIKGWEEYVSWHNPDDAFNTAIVGETSYKITEDGNDDAATDVFEVVKTQLKSSDSPSTEDKEGTERIFAKIKFIARKTKVEDNGSSQDSRWLYIFEKILGLPRSLYPENHIDSGTQLPAEMLFRIRVTGSPQAIKLLSPSASK
jgi:hypothetical protein